MSDYAITLDIDWAPDFAILDAARLLIALQVKATWFVTHPTPALDILREHSHLFELGIHPNFLPNSTQGRSAEEILDTCMSWVPEARCMRAHSLMQSTPLLRLVLARTPIRTDVSLFLPYASHPPATDFRCDGQVLRRLPYVWEDDIEFEQAAPRWDLANVASLGGDNRVLDFHPIHLALNSSSMLNYRRLLAASRTIQAVERADAQTWRSEAPGSFTAFSTAAAALRGTVSLTVSELARLPRT